MVDKKESTKEADINQYKDNQPQDEHHLIKLDNQSQICGVVMPISSINGLSESHWFDVKNIIYSSIENAGFVPKLVSDADESGIIQQRIIQNLYTNPIVICDVSCKNPNVMFELGLRLAFDKPTIIIKDDKTEYSFDTSVIEHLSYPRDLRHGDIETFKSKLSDKIKATFESSKEADYSTFLKHFRITNVEKLEVDNIPFQDFVMTKLSIIDSNLNRSIQKSQGRNFYKDVNKKNNNILDLPGNKTTFKVEAKNTGFNIEKLRDLFTDKLIVLGLAEVDGVEKFTVSCGPQIIIVEISFSNSATEDSLVICRDLVKKAEFVLQLDSLL